MGLNLKNNYFKMGAGGMTNSSSSLEKDIKSDFYGEIWEGYIG